MWLLWLHGRALPRDSCSGAGVGRGERETDRQTDTDTDTDTETDSLLEAKGHVASEAVWLVERTGKNTLRVQALSQNTEQESISWFLQDRSGAFSK